MPIRVLNPIVQPEYRNKLVIHLLAMHGNGENYQDVHVPISIDNPLLEVFLEGAHSFKGLCDSRVAGNYVEKHPFLEHWGRKAENSPYNRAALAEHFIDFSIFVWPVDSVYCNGDLCRLTAISFSYFDSAGIEHAVQYTEPK